MSINIIHKDFEITENIDTLSSLKKYYKSSLKKAYKDASQSVILPVISLKEEALSREEVIRIALDEADNYIKDQNFDVILSVPYDYKAYNIIHSAELEGYIKKKLKPKFSFGKKLARKTIETLPEPCALMPSIDACAVSKEEVYDNDNAIAEYEDKSYEELENKLNERLSHRADTFSEYLLYLIKLKAMTNVEVYKRACLSKQYFHKLNKNKDFHPDKQKALLLCVGAKLSLDETKDLLARAGYALSPSDMTDIIFSFFIENKHYDVIDIDIQLEEHGLPCIIS